MDLEYLHEIFLDEREKLEAKLDDVIYQINFFGATPELKEEQQEIHLLIEWLDNQISEVEETLLSLQA